MRLFYHLSRGKSSAKIKLYYFGVAVLANNRRDSAFFRKFGNLALLLCAIFYDIASVVHEPEHRNPHSLCKSANVTYRVMPRLVREKIASTREKRLKLRGSLYVTRNYNTLALRLHKEGVGVISL